MAVLHFVLLDFLRSAGDVTNAKSFEMDVVGK